MFACVCVCVCVCHRQLLHEDKESFKQPLLESLAKLSKEDVCEKAEHALGAYARERRRNTELVHRLQQMHAEQVRVCVRVCTYAFTCAVKCARAQARIQHNCVLDLGLLVMCVRVCVCVCVCVCVYICLHVCGQVRALTHTRVPVYSTFGRRTGAYLQETCMQGCEAFPCMRVHPHIARPYTELKLG